MKKNDFKAELKNMSIADLKERLDATRRELFSTRLNASTAHIKDYSLFKKLRRNIARLETIVRQKEQA